jgi:prepilin-type N-terminal cleavage/methylation domain-containing protein
MSIARVKPSRASGFTLLEITLAMAILGLMAVAIFRFVSTNMTAMRISAETTQENAAYSGLENLLTQQFQELPPGQGKLLGEAFKFEDRSRDEVTWICEAGPGLFTEHAQGQYSVTLRLRPIEHSRAMELGVLREGEDDNNEVPDDKAWVPLLDGIQSMEIRYFDPRLNAWVDRWTDRGTLPHLIRLTITRMGASIPWQAVIAIRRTPF